MGALAVLVCNRVCSSKFSVKVDGCSFLLNRRGFRRSAEPSFEVFSNFLYGSVDR